MSHTPCSPSVLDAPEPAHKAGLLALALGSVGVVYGDIGTSPLYALKESLKAASHGSAITPDVVVGIVSLILWTLVIVVTVKYVLLIMRADNAGEGGTLALMALAQRAMGSLPFIGILGMIGAALFYGDAVLTPAVSVLSAIEGIKLIAPQFEHGVIPLALAVITALFIAQSRGTARVATFFGPIMLIWFVVMALGGLPHIVEQPAILTALNPLHGARFLIEHGTASLFALGGVFLAVTGAEALYADMGHFGRTPIRLAWIGLVFPALALNYLGQGALILDDPTAASNPFFLLYPSWALVPLILLATMATVTASQAVISGAFSLTQQAIQLRLLPRMVIKRTSETEAGQIYVPRINWLLMAGVVALIVLFKSSDALASAYGIAVTGTMVITTLLAFLVAWRVWSWPPLAAAILFVPFLAVDLAFLTANSLKILDGGWLPVMFGAALLVVMMTWHRGTDLLADKERDQHLSLEAFLPTLVRSSAARVEGTAVFLTPFTDEAPAALLHNLKHNRVLHEKNVILTVRTATMPRVDPENRIEIEDLGQGFSRVIMRFGFMEIPNVSANLTRCKKKGLKFDVMKTSFFLSRQHLKPAATSGMPWWQDMLFIRLAGLRSDASAHFRIPSCRTLELGTQMAI